MHDPHRPYEKIFPYSMLFSLALVLLGLVLDTPGEILSGLYRIVILPDLLITDYVEIAGPGAALVNAGLVTAASMVVIKLSGEPLNGFTIVEIGLMAGFALFGKNIVNIWPIILGTWLYAKYQKEPFAKYTGVALLTTCLAPQVTYGAVLGNDLLGFPAGILTGTLTGVVIGFILPSLSAYTYKVQNGLNLYNMGFACGLFAMVTVPILTALGLKPESVLYWAEDFDFTFDLILSGLCVALILAGFFLTRSPPWAVWAGYRRLLSTTGRAPNDYLRMFGPGPVLVNMGINGLLANGYILAVGGNLNGPTVGGILTVMGFSAFGKHAFNIVPVMAGVFLGGFFMQYDPAYPALQIAALFGTTLAPISGHFGWPFGILAGFIHSALVLQTGGPVAGLNLYNNGFSGGLIALVLYPTLTAIVRHRQPRLRNEDYYDLFEETAPVDVSSWRTHEHAHDVGKTIQEGAAGTAHPGLPPDEDNEPEHDLTPSAYPHMPEDDS